MERNDMQLNRREMLAAGTAALIASQHDSVIAADETNFIPAFEFQDWVYQSFLVLPTPEQAKAAPGTEVAAKKWAMGKLLLSDGVDGGAAGFLTFAPGVQLKVTVKNTPGKGSVPATFEATGVGAEGVTKGAEYQLTGWAFRGADGKVESVRGSVRAVRGPDTKPDVELGKMPVGTVGAFVISKASLK